MQKGWAVLVVVAGMTGDDKGDTPSLGLGAVAAEGVRQIFPMPNQEVRGMVGAAAGTGPFKDALKHDHDSNSSVSIIMMRVFHIVKTAVIEVRAGYRIGRHVKDMGLEA